MANVLIKQEGDHYLAHSLWPPSPVVWVSSMGTKDRVPDVAPYSLNQFYSYVYGWPQVIVVGIGGHTGTKTKGKKTKKTYLNISESKNFVVNIPSEGLIEKITLTNLEVERPGFNKFKAYGLTPIPSKKVDSPSVGECKLHYECKLMKIEDFGGQTDLVFGEVVAVTADSEILKLSAEKRHDAIRPVYYTGTAAGKGLYYSVGRRLGLRDNEKYGPR
jgi:flavin reductase (DIM6/NTAB) family NADH-FMN oxidoreductase RutF